MAVTVVIEDASFETGARLAGLVAIATRQFEPVRVIVRDTGPLETWLSDHVDGRIQICNRGNFPYEETFANRVSAATSFLEGDSSDLVYVFGLGAADFALAARSRDRRVVLHAYQTASQIENLLARGQAKHDCGRFCDALLLAVDYRRVTLSRLFGQMPARVQNVGFRVDLEWLSRVTAEKPAAICNAAGEQLVRGRNFVVGGWSAAREDALFFLALARECPDLDFAWLGANPRGENGSRSIGEILAAGLPNLYAAHRAHHLWPFLPTLGAYVACAHEETIALPVWAAALAIPVIGFSTGGATELLGRYGILCHGNPRLAPLCAILRKIAAEPAKALVNGTEGCRRPEMDIETCVDAILQIMADVREAD